jgi:hypothetical protein
MIIPPLQAIDISIIPATFRKSKGLQQVKESDKIRKNVPG